MAIKDLSVNLTLNAEKFSAGLKRASDEATSFGKQLGTASNAAKIGYAAAAGAVVMLGRELAALAAKAEGIQNIAAKTGLATASVQQLTRTAESAGLSFETVSTSIKFLQRNLEGGNKAFAKLGLSIADLKQMTPEQQLQTVARAIDGLGTPAEKTAMAMKLLGRSGTELIPIVDDLAKGVGDLAVVMTDEQLESLARLDDALDATKGALSDAKDQFLAGAQAGGEFDITLGLINKTVKQAIPLFTVLGEAAGRIANPFGAIAGDAKQWAAFFQTGETPKVKGAAAAGFGREAPEAVGGMVDLSDAGLKKMIAETEAETRKATTAFNEFEAAAKRWQEAVDKLSGASAVREMDELRRQVIEIEKSGGAVKNVDALAKQIMNLATAGATIPKELIPTLIAAQANESEKATRAFAASLYETSQAAEDMGFDALVAEMDPLFKALESLGPTTTEVQREFKALEDALNMMGGPSKLTNQALLSMIKQLEDLYDTGKMSAEQMSLLGDLYTEALNRRIIPGMEDAAEAAFDWETALQGVALVAGSLGGIFGDVLGVVGNIGQSFQNVAKVKKQFGATSKEYEAAKFNAIAGGIGQIGGLIGQKNRKTGGAIQGAAGGAMTGFAVGGPLGAAIGGIAGGIMGFFGGRKKEKEEKAAKLAAEKEQYEGLIKAMERQYGSIMKARNAARLYGIDLKAAMDPKNPKALEAALADLEKRQAGMQTAMAGAAGLAAWKPTSDAGAKAQGALFGSVFWAAVKTEGLTKAAAALGDPFEEMWKNASESMQTLLAPIRQQLDLAKNESFAAAAEGSNALAELLSGLSDAGVVSIQDLSNASTVAQEQYNQALAAAQEQGLSGAAAQEAAIRAVGPAIAELIALHEQLGIPLDENLQKLKDTAEESGVMFPEDAMTRAAESMERVANALEKAFGFSTGLANNVDRIGRGRAPDYGDGGGGNGDSYPEYASGTGGPVRVKRDMIARIHAGEGLLVVPKNEMPAGGRLGWGSFERGIRGEESPYDRGTIEERRAGSVATGGVSGSETTAAAAVESTTMQVTEALEEVRQVLLELAAVQPITVQNAPVIELIDQSAVKTAEGQRAFGQFVTAEVERALDQNSRGLTTKIEQIARRAVSK